MLDIKKVLLNYVDVSLSVIYFHVGCNDLRKGYRGGPGYNGGHGKRKILHDMADLLYTARTRFPQAKVILNSVLVRRDIGYRALYDFNEQLEFMCNNFDVTYVETNCSLGRGDLARDGVHFGRHGVSRLSSLLVDVVSAVLSPKETTSNVNDEAEPSHPGLILEDVSSEEAVESPPAPPASEN